MLDEVAQADEPMEFRKVCCVCGGEVVLRIGENQPPGVQAFLRIRYASDEPATCETCSERQRLEEDAERERVRSVEARERREQRSGMPAKWRRQTFDGLAVVAEQAGAVARAREWAMGESLGLVLCGPVGRGKSAIAAAAATARLDVSEVRWLPVAELLLGLRMPFDSPEFLTAQRRLDASRGSAALVLDDLDKLKPTEHAVQPLYVAINAWLEAELPLLVTLNRDLDALASWLPATFGEAISSRLAGYCRVQRVGGVDRRLAR